MALCSRCGRSFRVLEDEEGMHECPGCGLKPGDKWDDPYKTLEAIIDEEGNK